MACCQVSTVRSVAAASAAPRRAAAGRRRAPPRRAAEAAEAGAEDKPAAEPKSLDCNQVMEILPHRYPFLLVDKVKEYVPGEYAIGVKNVTINDNFFPGHFPDRPIMPGVLQVEAMAQVGGIVMLDADPDAKGTFFFGGVDKCRFRQPVVPGDTLEMKVTLTSLRKRFGIAKMHGEAYVDGKLVCDVDMLLVTGK